MTELDPPNEQDLPSRRRALLRALLEKEGLATTPKPAIPPRPDPERAPLSFGQERLWYLWRLAPDTPAYNIPMAVRLEGPMDTAAFGSSLRRVVARHEALRTRFRFDGQAASQEILPELAFPFPLDDLSMMPPDDRQRALEGALDEQARTLFDLESPPLFRSRLVRLAPQVHVWLFSVHHIVADGWSLAVLQRELSQAYRRAVAGETQHEPPLAVQYPDFAHWQRSRVAEGAFRDQQAYWLAQLDGSLPEIDLPADRPRPPRQDFTGGWITRALPESLWERAQSLAAEEGATLLAVLLAAFKVLLFRYSNQSDVLLGSPVTYRSRRALEDVFGNFVNTQVLRTRLEGGMTFRALVRAVRRTLLDAFANQDLPVEQVIEKLRIPRDASRNPIFQTVFMLQEAPRQGSWRSALDLPGIRAEQRFTHSGTAKFDLTVEVERLDSGPAVSAEYSRAIFERATVERLLGHFETLLQAGTRRPDDAINHLPLLTAAELEQLERWNRTRTDIPDGSSVHAFVEAWARRAPERPALSFQGETLSYRELNLRANRLAASLLAAGVGAENLVGVLADRSFEAIIALLAVLKAGAAYLPLDPEYPPERLQFMLSDAGARALLVQPHYRHLCPFSGEQILLEPESPGVEGLAAPPNPELPVSPENLAYVMYTSGSTGLPKGAAIPHRGVLRLVRHTNYIEFSPRDVFYQLSPISFDAATLEIWGPLANGGCLAIAPPGPMSFPALAEAIRSENVSHLWLTAGLFHQMVEQAPQGLKGLRHLLTGGDVVSAAHVRRILPHLVGGLVSNGYGPTENTTFTTVFPVRKPEEVSDSTPIGFPIANTRVYLLDGEFLPVPVGVPGELYAAGDGLARGYHGRPALTAEKFLPDPFDHQGGRMYRTGDLARWRPDGSIEFIGRRDFQVKLRGYRIELGEIEARLAAHPGVRSAAVLARPGPSGDRQLVAYICPHPEARLQGEDLQEYLAAGLPAYMLPSTTLFLDAFPLTENGKLDRDALPAPDFGGGPTVEPSGPENALERTLVGIWQQVLGLEKVGVDDNFFDLGGNSLLILRAHAQIEQALGAELSVIELFTHPTIRALARALGGGRDDLDRELDEVRRRVSRRRRRPGR